MKTVTCQNLSQRGNFSNEQVQHFPNLYLTKIAGLQVESISNLRTSTVGRTHISQKKWKGFLHQTRLVGRHTREFNLYSLFFVRNMVGVLFLHHVPSTKNNHIYNGNWVGIIQLVNMNLQWGTVFYFSNCVQDMFFSFPTKLILSQNLERSFEGSFAAGEDKHVSLCLP